MDAIGTQHMLGHMMPKKNFGMQWFSSEVLVAAHGPVLIWNSEALQAKVFACHIRSILLTKDAGYSRHACHVASKMNVAI
jgi:hypothetical protein